MESSAPEPQPLEKQVPETKEEKKEVEEQVPATPAEFVTALRREHHLRRQEMELGAASATSRTLPRGGPAHGDANPLV